MIRIDFPEPAGAKWLAWRAQCTAKQSEHDAAAVAGRAPRANSKVYGGQKEEVYLHPDGPFHGKCAYCESDLYASQKADIDHFRPKGAIRDAVGARVKVRVGDQERDHPGYYWLAYEWTNLLPSCQLCNQPTRRRSAGKRIGKHDYFPLEDESRRATKRGEEIHEEPLLINPVEEDPARHLRVDRTGVIAAVPGTGRRGQACIDILGLNERDLPVRRRRAYQDVRNLMKRLADLILEDPNGAETRELWVRYEGIQRGAEPYTAVARLAIRDEKKNLKVILDGILRS